MAKLNAASFFGSSTTSSSVTSSGGGPAASQALPNASFNPSQLIQILNEYQSIISENKEKTKVDLGLIGSIRGLMSSMSLITSNLTSLRKTVTDHLKAHSALLKTKKPKPSYFESAVGDADRPGGWTKSPEKMTELTRPLGDMTKTTGLIAAATAGIMGAIASLQGPPGGGAVPDVSSVPGEQKLAAFVATLESSGLQDQADVLQSMYNRAGQNYSGYGGLFGQLTRYAQYSPLSAAIHDTPTGDEAADKKYGKIRSKLGNTPQERIAKLREIISKPDALQQLESIFEAGSSANAAKILDDFVKSGPLSQQSKEFIKGRTDFGASPGQGGATGSTIRRREGANYFGQNGSNIPASPPPTPPQSSSRTPDTSQQTSSASLISGGDVRVASGVEPSTKLPTPDLKLDESGKVAMMPFPIPSPQPAPMQTRPQFESQNSGTISPTDPKGSYIAGSLRIGSYVALG